MIEEFLLNPLPVLLILTGGFFLTLGAFLPSFGILSISGGLAFSIGAMMFISGEVVAIDASPGLTFTVAIMVLGLTAAIFGFFFRHRRRASDAIRNTTGEVVHWAGTEGEVFAMGQTWKAVGSDRHTFRKGDTVRVAGMDGECLFIKPLEP